MMHHGNEAINPCYHTQHGSIASCPCEKLMTVRVEPDTFFWLFCLDANVRRARLSIENMDVNVRRTRSSTFKFHFGVSPACKSLSHNRYFLIFVIICSLKKFSLWSGEIISFACGQSSLAVTQSRKEFRSRRLIPQLTGIGWEVFGRTEGINMQAVPRQSPWCRSPNFVSFHKTRTGVESFMLSGSMYEH